MAGITARTLAAINCLRSLLKGNVVRENGESGIESDVADMTLKANAAHGNGSLFGVVDGSGLGILVPPGTMNGGNKASGNDDPNECEAPDVSCFVP